MGTEPGRWEPFNLQSTDRRRVGGLGDLGGGADWEATGNELPPPPDQQQSQPQAPQEVSRLVGVGEEENGQATRPHLSREEKGGFPEKWVRCLPLQGRRH